MAFADLPYCVLRCSPNFTKHTSFFAALSVLLLPLKAADLPSDTGFLMAGYLDEGKAEFNLYEATIMQYNEPRQGTVTHIWVKEPWNAERSIKHQGPDRGDYEVIKLNQVISYPTGLYRYEQMWSGFWKRDDAVLVKWSLSHHEACGNTFKQARLENGRTHFVYHSYFEGHGEGSEEVSLPQKTLFYEELPLRLRLAVPGGLPDPVIVPLVGTVIHAKSDRLEPQPATIRQIRRDDREVEFEVTHRSGKDRLIFETTKPFKLLSWEMADGSRLRLHKSLVTDYWNQNRPGDEKLLE
ncbi:MAG: hypothetical protein OHK005_09790 [Candidatus Methylacidiphilales bacterium]